MAAARRTLFFGLIATVVLWHLSLVGMIQAFAQRALVGRTVTVSMVLILGTMFLMGYLASRVLVSPLVRLVVATGVGGIAGIGTALLALLITHVQIGPIFIAATPQLANTLTFQRGPTAAGILADLVGGLAAGLLGGALTLLPAAARRMVTSSLAIVLLLGLLRDVIVAILPPSIGQAIYGAVGLSLTGAIVLFILFLALFGIREAIRQRTSRTTAQSRGFTRVQRTVALVVLLLFLVTFPLWAKLFLSNVADFVGLYILMGLGLNLVLGFAGLLDLGYVAFFAVGAYTMGVLTSPDLGRFSFTFWEALPFAMIFAVLAGILIGLPVLRMRGDYLAITTLGFGEIVRLLFLSDWLKPYVGGAQGITRIARPSLGLFHFTQPQHFYYLILIGCAIAWFLSVRLRDSRIGRAWLAIREDEVVAQAMGINRVTAKLLAFGIGASFGGLSGALFASLVGSVVPASFQLLVSVNVVALLIIGGMGSLPGVVVGALALVGLPEMLREFQEYRLLVYGAVLILMMLFRPAGLWPEQVRVRELREAEEAARAQTAAEVVGVASDGSD